MQPQNKPGDHLRNDELNCFERLLETQLRARQPELALAARPAATGMAAQRGSDGPADAGRAAGARDHAARRVGM